MEKATKANAGIKKRKIKRALFIAAMLFFPALHFIIFTFYIGASSFTLAFQKYNYSTGDYGWAGWYNFRRVIEELTRGSAATPLTYAIVNSLEFYLLNTFILLPLGVFSAYFFWRKMPGHKVFRLAFFIPSLIPGIVLPMLFGMMLDSTMGIVNPILRSLGLSKLIPANGWLGDMNTAQPMVLLYTLWGGCGGSIILYAGNLNRLPKDIFESARLDGITLFKELWHLVLPLIWPVVSINIVMGSLVVFNVYVPSLMLTQGGPAGRTMTIAYMIIEWTNGGELTKGAAAGLFFSAIGIPVIMFIKWGLGKITPEVEY